MARVRRLTGAGSTGSSGATCRGFAGSVGATCRGLWAGGYHLSLVVGRRVPLVVGSRARRNATCRGFWAAQRDLSWVLGRRVPLVVGIRHDKSVLSWLIAVTSHSSTQA